MDEVKIPLTTARAIVIQAQLAGTVDSTLKGKQGAAAMVEKLGYVQIDTINVLNRAHHHTVWARMPAYQIEDIYSAQAQDKTIFEYWGHAMSYLPMKDFRYTLPYKHHFNDPYGKWEKERLEKYGHVMAPTLKRIREEGPMSTRDFEIENDGNRGTWWDWRPVKVALELLFWQGRLMVTERKKFQKVFDLTERVLPEEVDTSEPTEEDLGRFLVRRALNAYGLANEKEIVDHLRIASKKTIVNALKEMIVGREVLPVTVVGENGTISYYALAEDLEKMAALPSIKDEVFILSPFDNFCIQRGRMKTLFEFDYALECYLKPEQRKFGYFALPIFWKDRFVGKMDVKSERKAKRLLIHHLQLEEDFQPSAHFAAALKEKLDTFTRFQGCQRYEIGQFSPMALQKQVLGKK